MINRLVRAIRIDPLVFREAGATAQLADESLLIVLCVSVLSGAGAAMAARLPLLAFLLELLNSLVLGWGAWAAISGQVARQAGVRLEAGVLRRVLAYACAPRVLLFFGYVPFFGWFFRIAAWSLGLLAGVIALREYTGPGFRTAFLAGLAGLLPYLVASVLIDLVFGGMPMVGL